LKNIQISIEFSYLNENNFGESFINISDMDFSLLETEQIDKIFFTKINWII
jgi:hypothetical protein